jgi:hypothetical protein
LNCWLRQSRTAALDWTTASIPGSWEDNGGKLHIPAEHDFSLNGLLTEQHGRLLPKLISAAIERFVV